MRGLHGNSPIRTQQPAWWDNYLIALAGLLVASGLVFAAITAAYARAYFFAITLALVAFPFMVPTLVQIVTELLVYLRIVAAVVGFVVVLPVLVFSPALRRRAKQWWLDR